MGIAIGILPHTGWGWLVRVRGGAGPARAEARVKVVACQVLDGQLYHLAAEHRGDRAGLLAERRAEAVTLARRTLAPHLAGAGAAVVLGRQLGLQPLERIVAAHPRIHAAEGELWRAIFAEACQAEGVAATRAEAVEVRGALAARHGGAAVAGFLAAGRRELGAPWTREVQDAALAGWSSL
jgi:hypothetical protein